MSETDLDEFEYTLTRRALRQIKAEAWDEGWRASAKSPYTAPARDDNPYRAPAHHERDDQRGEVS